MSDLEPYELFVFVLGDSPPSKHMFPITAPASISVGKLKESVFAKKQNRLKGIDTSDLVLWKLQVPIPGGEVDEAVAALGQGLSISAVAVEMIPADHVSDYFPTAPPQRSLHVIVQRPTTPPSLPSMGKRHSLSEDDTDSEPAFKGPRHFGPESVVSDPTWCPRKDTVTGVLELLHKHHVVQVRGTPASGKTTLMNLLHARIVEKHPKAEVIILKDWPEQQLASVAEEKRMRQNLPGYPSFADRERYFLFDEGQTTYWDSTLWVVLKDCIQSRSIPVYAILFCNYGNGTAIGPGLPTPLSLSGARVILDRTDLGGSKPCGLLLDEKEFRDVIDRQTGKLLLAEDLLKFVYRFTRGHVGATIAVIQFVLKQQTSIVTGKPYHLEQFHKDTASYGEFCQHVYMDHGIRRGMPSNPAKYAQAMRALLLHGSIDPDDTNIHPDIASCLQEAYKSGCIDMDGVNQYTFASPLHQQLWSWHLLPQTDYQLPYQDLVSFVKDTISCFRPSRLDQSYRLADSASHRPPEAQYQEEYYRCVHNLTEGNVRISPEYAAACGSRPGRIDFFIPSKKWGIELTRDGNKLNEHNLRFTDGGAYGQWLKSSDMADYVLLDFRRAKPVQTHPGIRHLYTVVFSNDNTRVEIYDNQLNLQATQSLMQR